MNIPKDRIYDNININMPNNLDNVSTKLLLIDSSNRNWNIHNQSEYSVQIEPLKYVVSIQLVDYKIPVNCYNITKNNNLIYFQETTDQHENEEYCVAHIEEGRYTSTNITTAIIEAMNIASVDNRTYICEFNSITQKILIRSSHSFNLIWSDEKEYHDRSTMEMTGQKKIVGNVKNKYKDNCIGKVLGFNPKNLCHKKSYTADNILYFSQNEYVSLYLSASNSFGSIEQVISNNGNAEGAFAILPLINDFSKINILYLKKDFNPPITISQLSIKFITKDGVKYDFQGKDHYLLFDIKTVFGSQKVTNIKQLY